MRLCPRFSHKRATLHSPFPAPCGSRGKHRSPQLQTLPLFQDSRIAQPKFRNPRTTPTPPLTTTSDGFPLFLQQLLVLLSFLLISYPFPTTRRAPSALNAKPRNHSPSLPEHKATQLLQPPSSSNPEKNPCFPRTLKRKDEYNQEEQKTAISAGHWGDVELGQCGNAAFGPKEHPCRSVKAK